jgi:hypothetical protein
MKLLRRFPAAIWIAVYVASLLILNGSHGNADPVELSLGIGLVVAGCALGVYLAFGPWPDGRPRPRTTYWFVGGVIVFYGICAAAAWVFAGIAYGIATLLAGLIPLTAVLLWIASARRGAILQGDQMVEETAADHEDPVPALGADDVRPLGDSPEVHDEITPHDLPPDHPGREAAERQAREHGGTTPGHRDGGAAGLSDEPAAAPLSHEPSEPREERADRFEKDNARSSPRR